MHAVWVEFPVNDLERAMKFYQVVFDLQPTEIMADDMRRTTTLVSGTGAGVAGVSLNQAKNFTPGDKGVLVYLDAGEDLTHSLNRVEAAGGKIIEPKTSMGDAGNYAMVLDTEGNQFALYSYK
jgi:uncharacterized protein